MRFFAFTLLALTLCMIPQARAVQTGPILFAAELKPEEESAPTESPATGRAEFTLDRETLNFSWKVTFRGLASKPTGASVHGPQRPGGNAGILFSLAAKDIRSPLIGSVILTEGQLEYLLAGRLYVNIATTAFPAGEIRGQIQRLRQQKAP